MPEATVDEDGPHATAVRDVRRAGKIAVVNSITMAETMEVLANAQFWRRAVLSDRPETLGSGGINDELRLLRGSYGSRRTRHASDDRTQGFTAHLRQVHLERSEEARGKAELGLVCARQETRRSLHR
jgi:hypothetical protein